MTRDNFSFLRTVPVLLALSASSLWAQIPDGPGRAEVEKNCKGCHELARSISPRQDRNAWQTTMNKMVAAGMQVNDADSALIMDFLSKNFPADDVQRVNVNKASAIELESGLSLKRSQAAALVAYRAKHGNFKSFEDLKKIPELATSKIETKKDRIAF